MRLRTRPASRRKGGAEASGAAGGERLERKRRRRSGFVSVMGSGVRRRLRELDREMREEEGEGMEMDELEEETVNLKDVVLEDGELGKLKAVWEKLKKVKNGEAEKYGGLKGLCKALVEERLLESSLRRERILVCCCLVELLRIFAPHPPFEANVLQEVFRTMTKVLAGLRTDEGDLFVMRFALLEQLATIKAYALVANETQDCEDVFLCFYSLAKKSHSIKLQTYLADILCSLLDEADVIAPSTISILLSPLTHPDSYKDPAAAKDLASIVVVACQNALTTPLSNLLNASLAGDPKPKSKVLDCDLSSLLVQLNQIAPELLIHVIPHLESDARHPSVTHRSKCVTILSQLFSSSKRMVSSYPSLYCEYLDRSIDVDPDIRACVSSTLGALLSYAAQDAPPSEDIRCQNLSKRLRDRLLDADERVRAAAVSAAGQTISVMNPELQDAFGSRLKDKKNRVRYATLDAMVAAWHSDNDGWIPRTMLVSYPALKNIGDAKATDMIETALFDTFIPWSGDAEERVTSFLGTVSACDDQALGVLTSIVRRRAQMRRNLMELIASRLGASRKHESPSSRTKYKVEHATASFGKRGRMSTGGHSVKPCTSKKFADLVGDIHSYQSFPKGETTESLITSLLKVPDLKVIKSLEVMFDLLSSTEDIKKAEEDVLARLSSKEHLRDFFQKVVVAKAAPRIFTDEHVHEVASLCISLVKKARSEEEPTDAEDVETMRSCLRFLELMSLSMPEALSIAESEILRLIGSGVSEAQITGLKILSRIGARSLEIELKSKLISLMIGDHSKLETAMLEAKWATRALVKISQSSGVIVNEREWEDITSKLTELLDGFDGQLLRIIAPLTSLSQLAKFAPKEFRKPALESHDFVRSLLCGSFNARIATYHSVTAQASPSGRKGARSSGRDDSSKITVDNCLVDAVKGATKVLVNSLSFVDAADELPLTIRTLTNVLRINGDIFRRFGDNNEDGSDSDSLNELCYEDVTCGLVRLASALAILRLARNPAYFQKLRPSAFLSCLLTAQDPLPDVRLSFARKIHSMILRKRLPFRWITGLALMAIDPDRDNLNEVKELTASLILRRRYVIRNLSKNSQITNMLPEAELPVLLWVVANHPDSVTDAGNGFEESSKYLEFFLDRLLDAHDYASLLSQKLQAVSMAEDAVSQVPGSGERLVALARLGGSLLQKKQAGRRWNLDKIPGDVCLPADLFRTPYQPGGQPRNLVDVARNFDARVEDTSTVPTRTPGSMRKRIKAEETPPAMRTPGRRPRGQKSVDLNGHVETPVSGKRRRRRAAEAEVSGEDVEQTSMGRKRRKSGRKLESGDRVVKGGQVSESSGTGKQYDMSSGIADVGRSKNAEDDEEKENEENKRVPKSTRVAKKQDLKAAKKQSAKSKEKRAPLRRSARNRK